MRRRQRLPAAIAGVAIALIACATAARERVAVGVVIDGPWQRNVEIESLLQASLAELLGREHDLRLDAAHRLVADWTPTGVRAALDRLLTDPAVDVVVALGAIASHDAAQRGALPKPTFAPFVLDIELQQMPYRDGASGVRNLNYLTATADLDASLRALRELLDYRHLVLLANPHYNFFLERRRAAMRDRAREMEFELTLVSVEADARAALDGIPGDADAVLVAPLIHLPAEEMDRLVAGLIDRRLATFSIIGEHEVDQGLLAGLTPNSEWERVMRRVALNIQRAVLGADPGEMPVDFELRQQLRINMATARAIGVYPSFAILTEAVAINQERAPVERKLSLAGVVAEALAANLDVLAQARVTAAGAEEVRRARSVLLPQVDVAGRGLSIDSDRAEASFGGNPERTLDVVATVRQLLWSDPARSNLEVQESLQLERALFEKQVRLDVVNAAVRAYLDVLRANTVEEIARENLKVTRSNLDLARVRRQVGVAGPGEVHRWESQIATDRRRVIEAQAVRNLAEIELNRLLDRPGEAPFDTTEVTLDDLQYLSRDPSLRDHINDPWSFDIFRDFMTEEGLSGAPELRQIDALIAAQERVLLSARRSFWSPTVTLGGELGHRLAKGGAGLGGAPGPIELPLPDDTSWSIAIDASLPLYQGGARPSEVVQATEELARLHLARRAVANLVESRMRSALHRAGASHAGIDLSRAAADAAYRNLEVVKDSYSRGVASVIDLLDAQNSAIASELTAASAIYDHMSDINDVERAAGHYLFLGHSEEGRADFFERLHAFRDERRRREER